MTIGRPVETVKLALGLTAIVIRRGEHVPSAPPPAVEVDESAPLRGSRRARAWPGKYRQQAPHPGSGE